MIDRSRLIARILSLVYLSAALGGILSAGYYRRVIEGMFHNAALSYLAGLMGIILGCLVVYFHNVWKRDWTVLITLVGWIALIKGVLLIALPEVMERLSGPWATDAGFRIFPYVGLVIGVLFGYLGFVHKRA